MCFSLQWCFFVQWCLISPCRSEISCVQSNFFRSEGFNFKEKMQWLHFFPSMFERIQWSFLFQTYLLNFPKVERIFEFFFGVFFNFRAIKRKDFVFFFQFGCFFRKDFICVKNYKWDMKKRNITGDRTILQRDKLEHACRKIRLRKVSEKWKKGSWPPFKRFLTNFQNFCSEGACWNKVSDWRFQEFWNFFSFLIFKFSHFQIFSSSYVLILTFSPRRL